MNKLLLLLSLVVGTAGADNLISIEQIGTGNSNTVSVTVDGSDNEVDYSFGINRCVKAIVSNFIYRVMITVLL
mgnify:CR=1 FL=1